MKINLICKVRNNLFALRFFLFLIVILEVIHFYYNHNKFLCVINVYYVVFIIRRNELITCKKFEI